MQGLSVESFGGLWAVDRLVEDLRAGRALRLAGQASLSPGQDGGPWLYRESATLRLAEGSAQAASPQYLWRQSGKTTIAIADEHGQPLHDIKLDRMMPDATLLRGADLHHVTYDFSAWPRWTTVWRVVGPERDLRSLSVFQRPG